MTATTTTSHSQPGQSLLFQGQIAPAHSIGQSPSSGAVFSMSNLTSALSEPHGSDNPRISQAELPHLQSLASNIPLGIAAQQAGSFAGQTSMNTTGYGAYSPQYATQPQHPDAISQVYSQTPAGHHAQITGPSSLQQQFPNPGYYNSPHQQPYPYYPNQYGHFGSQHQGIKPHPGIYSAQYHRSPAYPHGQGLFLQQSGDLGNVGGRYLAPNSFPPGPPAAYGFNLGETLLKPGGTHWAFFPCCGRRADSSNQAPLEQALVQARAQSRLPPADHLESQNSPVMRFGWAIFRREP